MAVYELQTLMEQTRTIASDYLRLTGKTLPVTSEIAKFDVGRILSFDIPQSPTQGIDFLGTGDWEGQKITVKSRVVTGENCFRNRLGKLDLDSNWDQVLLVLLNTSYVATSIDICNRQNIVEQFATGQQGNNKKGSLTIGRYLKIATRLWEKTCQH